MLKSDRSTHHTPVRVIDPETNKPSRFRLFINAEPSDNPMQSEVSGHIGGNGNFFCRKCEVGGTTASKATDDGFHALFMASISSVRCKFCLTYVDLLSQPGERRSKTTVLDALKEQVALACLGVEKNVRTRQTETGVKDSYTEYSITELIRRAREEKKNSPTRSREDIQAELLAWVDEHQDAVYNPFLTMPGMYLHVPNLVDA